MASKLCGPPVEGKGSQGILFPRATKKTTPSLTGRCSRRGGITPWISKTCWLYPSADCQQKPEMRRNSNIKGSSPKECGWSRRPLWLRTWKESAAESRNPEGAARLPLEPALKPSDLNILSRSAAWAAPGNTTFYCGNVKLFCGGRGGRTSEALICSEREENLQGKCLQPRWTLHPDLKKKKLSLNS